MKNKALTILLLCSMLLGTALTSCSNSSDIGSTDATTANDTQVDIAETTEAAPIGPEIVDYDGYTFRIRSNRNEDNAKIDVDEETGDLINDAVYARNRKIEADYNIDIELTHDTELSTNLPTFVTANEDFADIVFLGVRHIFPMAQNDYLINWNEVDDIMLNAEWWDERAYDQLSIGDKFYTLYGDISTEDEILTLVPFYNKTMYNEYGFDNAYDMVDSGTWTFDKFWEYVSAVSADIDGDGSMTVADRFGLITEYSAFTYFYAGAGYKTIEKSGDGFKLNTSTEKAFNIVEKMSVIATEKNLHSLICDDGTVSGSYETGDQIFNEGRALFSTGTLKGFVDLRAVEGDYGVLPIPKYEESQDGYYNLVSWNAPALILPATVSDTARSSIISDALAYYSMLNINDLFFNVFLDEKATRDEESKEMLDIIFATKSYDLDWYASVSGFTTLLGNIAKSGQNNFASEYAKIETSAQAKLDEFVAAFND